MTDLYAEADRFFVTITQLLDKQGQSQVLQDYFVSVTKSLFYATVMNNFFKKLTPDEISASSLPVETINEITTKYSQVKKEVDSALSNSLQKSNIDKKYYEIFKSNLTKDFPEFLIILSKIEEQIDIDEADAYFDKKRKELEKVGKPKNDLNEIIMNSLFETYVQKENRFPSDESEFKKMMDFFPQNLIKPLSDNLAKELKKDTPRMLKEQRKYQKGFESRLYNRWKEPIDLLESQIRISTETVNEKRHKLEKSAKISEIKKSVLLQLHARALQISCEILALIKSGFADGANARWRSLLEIDVITFFLRDKNDEILQRYLEHEIIRKYKEAVDYQKYHKRLGEEPLEDKEFALLEKIREDLIQKYGKEFSVGDYGWIPKSILKNNTFRGLLESVNLDQLQPYYNFSTNATHGSSRGFHRLGLIHNSPPKVLLAGASNYGFADPLQNTALSLLHVTICFLLLEPDFESLIIAKVMDLYFKEIGEKAVKIQKAIEAEEKEMPDDTPPSGFIIE